MTALLSCLVSAGLAIPGAAGGHAAPLRAHGNARVIPIGTAVNAPDLFGGDRLYARTLDEHFTAITPEWNMEWDHTEPERGRFTFGRADAVVNYGIAHGMSVHGHCLVWSQELPAWVTDGHWSKASLEGVLRQHIETEVRHFAGRVNEWDVVNEPFNNDGTYTENVFLRVIGPAYIPLAFRWAHEADPRARLFLNDYDIDWPGPKERATLALARRLLGDGLALGGIGLEEHLSLAWVPSPAQLRDAMAAFAALGLRVEVSEADVATAGYRGATTHLRAARARAARPRAAQAAAFGELARACRAQPACTRFTVWGVSDAVSWLGASAAALPFSVRYRPTRSWQAILAGLKDPASPRDDRRTGPPGPARRRAIEHNDLESGLYIRRVGTPTPTWSGR